MAIFGFTVEAICCEWHGQRHERAHFKHHQRDERRRYGERAQGNGDGTFQAQAYVDHPIGHQPTGDRVEGLGDSGKPTGEFGIVQQANEDDAVVKWDDDGRMRVHEPSLKKV